MSIRQVFEERERSFMSPFGCLSAESKGRMRDELPCPIRTVFQRDRDRILYSMAFRRLKHKTQVFLAPLGAQYRTRLTHTLEVAQMARTITRAMRLNEDLAEAIALGHDLGHTPFGHSGEMALKEIYSPHFSHPAQSLRVVDKLENAGKGLNLTREVRDGILKHSKGYGKIIPDNAAKLPITYEGRIVRFADIMAYLNHDLDDAVRSGLIEERQIPEVCMRVLGPTHSVRATTMVHDIVNHSYEKDGELVISMTDEVFGAMSVLRQFLYDDVYRADKVHREFIKSKKLLSELYAYYLEDHKGLFAELERRKLGDLSLKEVPIERRVCDLIATLTDRQALDLYRRLFFPAPVV
jgi:dGTPase